MRLCFRMSLFWVCSGLDTTQSFIFWIINALLHLHIIMLGKCKIQSERVGENIAALMSTSIRNKAYQLRRIQKVFIIHLRVFGQISWKVIHHIPSIPAAGGHCEQRQVWCWMWTWIIEVAGGIEDWRLLSAGGQHLCSVLGPGRPLLVPHLQFITLQLGDSWQQSRGQHTGRYTSYRDTNKISRCDYYSSYSV